MVLPISIPNIKLLYVYWLIRYVTGHAMRMVASYFPPRKSKTVGAIVWALIMLLVIVLLIPLINSNGIYDYTWLGILLSLLAVVLLLWIWFGTYYKVDVFYLRYYVGPFRGKIPIAAIRDIQYQHIALSEFLHALSLNGLLIRYNQDDVFYVAPKNKARFICELQKYNPHIRVIRPTDQMNPSSS